MIESTNQQINVSLPRIVAFTKDWDDVPTCTTHVLREMGKTMPVLWVSSIGTRKPQLTHPAHIGRLFKRLASGFRRAELKENNLRVLNPVLIPKAQSRAARWINRRLFAWQAGRELEDMGNGRIEYWCFVPNAVDLLPVGAGYEHRTSNRCGESEAVPGENRRECQRISKSSSPPNQRIIESTNHRLPRINESTNQQIIVYYCVDDWTQFHYLDTEWMARKERELLARADVVFAVSRYLVDRLEKAADDVHNSQFTIHQSPSTIHYAPHGVEYEKFRGALNAQPPDDVAHLQKPVIGFYGNIYPWVDLRLVKVLAEKRPEWSFVMIGGVFCDVSIFDGVANVHFLGRREHDKLPHYCAAFDVAIIPYDMRQSRMESVNPVKTRELLAAGVPVVAADVPELRALGEDVLIARTPDEWINAVEKQMSRDDHDLVSRSVQSDDWANRVDMIRRRLTCISQTLIDQANGPVPEEVSKPAEMQPQDTAV